MTQQSHFWVDTQRVESRVSQRERQGHGRRSTPSLLLLYSVPRDSQRGSSRAVRLPGSGPGLLGFPLSPQPFYPERGVHKALENAKQLLLSNRLEIHIPGWSESIPRSRGRGGPQRSVCPRELTQTSNAS